jgi:hypothetical protein
VNGVDADVCSLTEVGAFADIAVLAHGSSVGDLPRDNALNFTRLVETCELQAESRFE